MGIDLRDKPEIIGAEQLAAIQNDIIGATVVNIKHDQFAGQERIWINVNGICVLRTLSTSATFDLQRVERLEQAINLVRSDLAYGIACASSVNEDRSKQMSRRLTVIDRILKEGAR